MVKMNRYHIQLLLCELNGHTENRYPISRVVTVCVGTVRCCRWCWRRLA